MDVIHLILQTVLEVCGDSITDPPRLEAALTMALHNYVITPKTGTEEALSVVVEKPNEWYVNQFLAIKVVRGLSKNTLRAYREDLLRFLSKCGKPIREITTNDIRYYLAITQQNVSDIRALNIYRVLHTFFATLEDEELVLKNPTKKLTPPKITKKIKKPFSDEDVARIRSYATRDARLKALIEVFLSTGCRVSEISSANRSAIDGDRLLVLGKGNKERYVFLNAAARVALAEYFESRTDRNDALFVSVDKPFNRLAKGQIESIFREIGNDLQIGKCHPHRFRRTMATNALRSGMPIEQVSQILGHESLDTTQIYARSTQDDIHNAHVKFVK